MQSSNNFWQKGIALLLLAPLYFTIAAQSNKLVVLDSLLATKAFNPAHPGLSIMVAKDGAIIYAKTYGMANLKKNIPITDHTIYNMGSVTKQFTAFCILKLEKENRIKLSDSIQKYIPELPFFGRTITIDHLLCHTSGIPDYLEVLGLNNRFTKQRLRYDYMLQYFKKAHTLSFMPGEHFAYSNTGYMLLCLLVERVSNMPIENYVKENIFIPLGMKTARFTYYEADGMPDGTASYYWARGRFKKHKPVQPNAMGATGIFCSLGDYFLWDKNCMHPTPETQSIVTQMKQPHAFNNGHTIGYGAGIILKPYKGYLSEEHSGGWNSFLVQFRRLPQLGLSIFVASTTGENKPFRICDEITDIFLPRKDSAAEAPATHGQPLTDLWALRGTYIDAGNIVRKVVVAKGRLGLANIADTTKWIQELIFDRAEGDSLIRFRDGNNDYVDFVKKDHQLIGFKWEGGSYFRHQRYFEKLGPIANNDAAFVGKYASTEMAYAFKIKQANSGGLKLRQGLFKGYALEPVGANVFKVKSESIYLRFYDGYVTVGNEWVFHLILPKVK